MQSLDGLFGVPPAQSRRLMSSPNVSHVRSRIWTCYVVQPIASALAVYVSVFVLYISWIVRNIKITENKVARSVVVNYVVDVVVGMTVASGRRTLPNDLIL